MTNPSRFNVEPAYSSLRILIADDDDATPLILGQILPSMGHVVVGTARTGRTLVELCRQLNPDLVITDVMMPDMDGITAAGQIYHDSVVPVILLTAHYDAEFIRRAEESHVMAYLVKPISQAQLEPAIVIAMRRFREFEALRRDEADLRQALADRKIIERAKGILMSNVHLDEPAAFRRLQKLASEKNRKLVDVAQLIVAASEALGTPDGAVDGRARRGRTRQ